MRSWGRCVLVALISSGMLTLPIRAAEDTPFGIVALADQAHVGTALASTGATVYTGDSVDTSVGGALRLRVGTGQLYLLSASAANLSQDGSVLRASVLHGTVGFSSLTAREFELETPEGIIRAANGLPAYGQVTITSPKEAVVSAYRGTLLLERDGQQLSIEAGKSYDVSLVPDADATPPQGQAGVKSGLTEHLVWKLVVIGTMGVVAYVLWRYWSESPVDPPAH
ncbi:MAG TPA: hypothetical protein VJW93_15610 [Candidatus Acidoferrales bacterium]|nr:hypothetical protein [Candidatus Acidoferrales bacterium]